MPKIKWTKEDVIKKFQEAITQALAQTSSGQGAIQGLLNTAKKKIGKLAGKTE